MALSILYLVFDLLLGVTAFSPEPRVTWELSEVNLTHFHEPEVFNYSVLLLSEDENVLYVGAREAIFAVNSLDISEKQHELYWKASEDQKNECAKKGKSKQTECFNYVRVLQPLNKDVLYVCGTNAFQPTCDHLNLLPFKLAGRNEDGKGRSPFDPMQSYTSVMIDGELYSGTSFTFLGNEPIIFRQSQQNQLRTEYSVLWLNDPNFVSADVIRHSQNMPKGYDDDKVYFFFTEVSVEFDFVGKVMIPRVARVCKGDQGGLRILQKKWTTFLKATLLCRMPEWNYIFNVVNDVFILKSPNLKEPLIYGVFTAQLNNIGVSAVCAYNMSSVEEVFAKGKYMQSATVEQSDTKWVRYNGEIPKPRPGACINSFDRAMNFNSSLSLPDKTLQFVKDHPLMYDSVTPLGNKPQLVKRDVNYTQIVVDRVKALDGNTYNVMFIGTDEGTLHKAISSEHGMHIIEEIKLFPVSEPIQTLLLSSKEEQRYVYAGSNSGVMQSPVAFCEKYSTCVDCVLARDPYCAWSVYRLTCVNILQEEFSIWDTIQHINGDATSCFGQFIDNVMVAHHKVNLGGTVELKCSPKANLASISWKLENQHLNLENPNYHPLKDSLLIFNVKKEDTGAYYCLSEEKWLHNIIFSHVIVKHVVELQRPLHTTTSPNSPATQREASSPLPFPPTGSSSISSVGCDSHPSFINIQPEILNNAESTLVTMLPPFLGDQALMVSFQGTFHLFCQATGPKDAHFVWEKNGKRIANHVTEQSHILTGDKVHVLSWVKDIATTNSEYHCSITSKSGNQTSKVIIRVEGPPSSTSPESDVSRTDWSKDFANWKSAVSEHDTMMQGWKRIWENCEKSVH
ncbi:semaphorin-4D isoform X3 [Microcaecilia unicolor]|uniref:Semaphorin-4D isoform X3 n=1 Tax=Microcaecilia unicolor TaxID=1415580 RepID=A0A6P7XFP6_9AMPH|nr:semaphorin-4D isoform X3 [Microcaecilia unicolor]